MPLDLKVKLPKVTVETSMCLPWSSIIIVFSHKYTFKSNRKDPKGFSFTHPVWGSESRAEGRDKKPLWEPVQHEGNTVVQKQELPFFNWRWQPQLLCCWLALHRAVLLWDNHLVTFLEAKLLKFRSVLVLVLWKRQYEPAFVWLVLIFLSWYWGSISWMSLVVFKSFHQWLH